MERSVYVYKLKVTYPEGSLEPGWRPPAQASQGWLSGLSRAARGKRPGKFRWPRERMFLSGTSAYRRAGRLESLGARVEVYRSAPVTWDNPPACFG